MAFDLAPHRPSGSTASRRAVPCGTPLHLVCRLIVDRHHRYLRETLPRLSELAADVERAHVVEDHRLEELRNVFERLRAEMEAHMAKEERLLFPLCRDLEFGRRTNPVQAAVTMLEREHDEARAAFARLRELTDGFDVERVRCPAHSGLVAGLAALWADTAAHIELERTVLFPRALVLAGH